MRATSRVLATQERTDRGAAEASARPETPPFGLQLLPTNEPEPFRGHWILWHCPRSGSQIGHIVLILVLLLVLVHGGALLLIGLLIPIHWASISGPQEPWTDQITAEQRIEILWHSSGMAVVILLEGVGGQDR